MSPRAVSMGRSAGARAVMACAFLGIATAIRPAATPRYGARASLVSSTRANIPPIENLKSKIQNPQEASAVSQLRRALASADAKGRKAAIARFEAEVRAAGTPLPAPGSATFVYAGAPGVKSVQLAGDITSWNPHASLPLARIPGTDLFTRTVALPRTARIEYQLVVEGRWLLDPWARDSSDNGLGGRNSCFAMPGYRDRAQEAIDPQVPHGVVDDQLYLSDGRRCAVYMPPGYQPNSPVEYPTLYLQDGLDYLRRGRIAEIVDTLIARRRIRPLIVVMVSPLQRTEEYSLSDRYVSLILDELIPRIDRFYRTDRRPQARAVGGASMGGIAAAGLALEHPELFGAALCQSGAYQVRDGFVLRLAARRPHQPVRFWIDVGLYDLNFGGESNLLYASRRFRAALQTAGYRFAYREVPEGHNWTHWRGQLPDALTWLFPYPEKHR